MAQGCPCTPPCWPRSPGALLLLELCWFFCAPVSPPELCGVCAVGANPAATPWIPEPALTFRSAARSRSCLPALQGHCLVTPGPCHRHWQGVSEWPGWGGFSKGWGHQWSRDPTARTLPDPRGLSQCTDPCRLPTAGTGWGVPTSKGTEAGAAGASSVGQASPCRNSLGYSKLFLGDVLSMAGSPDRLDGAGMSHCTWLDKVPGDPSPLPSVAEGCARVGRVEEAMAGPVGGRPMAWSETG